MQGLELVGCDAIFEEQLDGNHALVLPDSAYVKIALPNMSPWLLADEYVGHSRERADPFCLAHASPPGAYLHDVPSAICAQWEAPSVLPARGNLLRYAAIHQAVAIL